MMWLLTNKSNCGTYVKSIGIPNIDEITIKKAINQINGSDSYLESNCVDWKYNSNNNFGRYFDQVLWKDMIFEISELEILHT